MTFHRIQLSVFNAQKALNNARINLKNADYELKKYIGLDQNQVISLSIPLDMILWEVDPDKALEESLENRKETPSFERRLIQADRDLTQAKRNAGVNATLNMSYGISNSANILGGIYENHRATAKCPPGPEYSHPGLGTIRIAGKAGRIAAGTGAL